MVSKEGHVTSVTGGGGGTKREGGKSLQVGSM